MLNVTQLKELSKSVLETHRPMMSLYQEIAENFYPERADFTITRNVGVGFADSLFDSKPVLLRRDLGDSIGAMLRDGDWFEMGVQGEEPDNAGKLWLEWVTRIYRGLINDRRSGFDRATKEGDHDFVTFGPCVISTEINPKANGLLYRNWHLRDCAWYEDEAGEVCGVVRKWRPKYRDVVKHFGDKAHKDIKEAKGKDAFEKEAEIRHLCLPAEDYGDEKITSRFKYVSVYLDVKNDHIMEVTGQHVQMYTIPRFKTIAGSPFAYSPSTMLGLPDGRMIQSMQHTLIESAERYARPPILATQKAVRSDVNLAADGITWIDNEYDEREGAALRTLAQDKSGYPVGADAKDRVIDTLGVAFYSDVISLKDLDHEMTAYEFGQRLKQLRRQGLPLFQPIEKEYNAKLIETGFMLAFHAGFFGSIDDIPDSLRGKDIEFQFVSPLSQMEEEKEMNHFQHTVGMLEAAGQFDPSVIANVDMDIALRDGIKAGGAPEEWLNSEDYVTQQRQALALAQAAQVLEQAEDQGEV